MGFDPKNIVEQGIDKAKNLVNDKAGKEVVNDEHTSKAEESSMRTSRRLPISSVSKTLVFKNSPHHENECGEFFCIRRPLPADS